uniref:SCP domain-containing protein n=1 Tax=Glossina brevipalpis TaxID=37001 RepID=A0A1A9W8Y6_9MUSC
MNYKILVYLLLLRTTFILAEFEDYCREDLCPTGRQHIGCNIPERSFCPPLTLLSITEVLKKFITDAHNHYRNYVAWGEDNHFDRACRMATMQWDDELAKLAELRVLNCNMEEKEKDCHNTENWLSSGQNIQVDHDFEGTSSILLFSLVFDRWYNASILMDREKIKSYSTENQDVNSFLLMMLDHNDRVGCAAISYDGKGGYLTYIVVCNYAADLNKNIPVYTACRETGASCKTGENSEFIGLCSINEKYDREKL